MLQQNAQYEITEGIYCTVQYCTVQAKMIRYFHLLQNTYPDLGAI